MTTQFSRDLDRYLTTEPEPIDEEWDANWMAQFEQSEDSREAEKQYRLEMEERALAGELCICCHWRKMGGEGDLSFGSGYCEKCFDQAWSLMGGR